jgi:hypothetical protein
MKVKKDEDDASFMLILKPLRNELNGVEIVAKE